MVNARKLGIGKLALLVLGAAVGGCTEEEAILGRVAIAGVSANPRVVANPEASAWASAFSAGSQAQLNSINAGKMGTNVNVNVYDKSPGNVTAPAVTEPIKRYEKKIYDFVKLKNGNYLEGEIVAEKPSEIIVDIGVQLLVIPKEQIFEYVYRQ